MGKTGRWIRNFLTGKREKEKGRETRNDLAADRPTTPTSITQPTTPKEKRRWSFRRSSAANPAVDAPPATDDPNRHALAVATAAAADAAVAAAKAAAAVMQLTAAASSKTEEAAATKIQSVFRAYLARNALNALKGLVKLQALVRGHLVRKQATATLRCMQALVTVQARARAQRMKMAEETKYVDQVQFNHRKSTQEYRFRNSNLDLERKSEENIKIVEMDRGDYKSVTRGRSSYSNNKQPDPNLTPTKQDHHHHHHHQQQISPVPSAITDISPRTCSNHFEDYSLQSSPQCYSSISKPDQPSYPRSEYAESLYNDYPFYPNYMANTQSSRAKVRSHSAPKQRPAEAFERQPSTTRRRPSIEGRNVPRAVRMQRSSSHVGSAAQNYHYPWSVKLDRSAVSLKDSECGSTSTMLTNTNYCRSLVGFEVQGSRY